MDIDILLALQDFRNNIGAPLVDFFSKMTFLGELNSAIVIMAVVYWCCSKSFGSTQDNTVYYNQRNEQS